MNNKYKPSEKSFGITFSFLFFILFIYFYISYKKIYYFFFIFIIIFFIFSFFFKKIFIIPNLLWFKFGILLSKIFSPILYSVVFYFLIFPISLLMKIFFMKKSKKQSSNWIKSNVGIDFKKQF